MSFVVIDIGASGSRYCSDNGQISVVPNNMVIADDNAVSNLTSDTPEIEGNLEVFIEQTSRTNTQAFSGLKVVNDGLLTDPFPAHVFVGLMAEKHKEPDERPNMLMHKHVQRINYISAVLACALSKLKNGLDDHIDLYMAVPPVETQTSKDIFKAVLPGTYKVTFPKYMGGTVIEFTIDDTACYEESLMASTSYFFNMNGTLKDASKQWLTCVLLSLDIGASTTDVSIIKKGSYLDKSGFTIKTGGNEALDYLIDEVRTRYGYDLPHADAEIAMAEGRLQNGNAYDDISDIIFEAKKSLAKKITNEMVAYFKRISFPIQMINAIMVSGGGSLQSQYVNGDGEIVKTSEPMSFFVTNEMKKWCANTDVIEYGPEARLANVKGLFIRAKMDETKKARAATVAQPAAPAPQPVAPQVAPTPVVTPQPAVAHQPVAPQPVAQPVATPVQTPVAPTQA